MSDWEHRRAARGEDLRDDSTLDTAVTEIVEHLGYECVHVSIKTDSGRPRLQVLIDSLGGINTDDCETVSKALNRMLDARDASEAGRQDQALAGQYYLEVSSPGLERPLFTPAHYERFKDHEVRVQLAKPVEGRKTVTGKISQVTTAGTSVTVMIYVESEEREVTIPFEDIKNGRLVFRAFESSEPKRAGKSGRQNKGTRRGDN